MPRLDEVLDKGHSALRRVGVSEKHAKIQLSLLLNAELKGVASHGLLRLPRIIERVANGVTDPSATGEFNWHSDALGNIDGQRGLGPIVGSRALEEASLRAKKTGIAAVAVKNCDHLGMLAWYMEKVALGGQIGICLTISEALVHPWGGRKAMIGTNPIAIGIPSSPRPFVMDMATSLVSMGKIHDYANRGEPIPKGWALDAHGDPTEVASEAKHGAIAPFGGAKGYALGLGFELLVAMVTGSAIGDKVKGTLDSDHPCNKGDLFIVIEPSEGAYELVNSYLEDLRQSSPMDTARPVRIPGDKAHPNPLEDKSQEIELAKDVWQRICELAE